MQCAPNDDLRQELEVPQAYRGPVTVALRKACT